MPSFKFSRKERLKSEILFNKLFDRAVSSSFSKYPLRIIWVPNTHVAADSIAPSSVQMALSVPKRAFPKAAHRNRLRRQVREAYRLHKHLLVEALPPQKHFAIMLLYTAKEPVPYADIEAAVQKIIERFLKKII